MARTLDQARALPNSLSPATAENGTMMPDLKAVVSRLSVRFPTQNQIRPLLNSN